MGPLKKKEWWGARVVEWDGLENRYTCKGIVSSNLTPTESLDFDPIELHNFSDGGTKA